MKITKAMTESMSQPAAPSEKLLYPNLSAVNEQYINEKIQANKKFNNNINIIKDIRNYYETETNNYDKKLNRYKNYINVAEIITIIINSNNGKNNSSCINRYRITLFYTNSFCDSNCLWFIIKNN